MNIKKIFLSSTWLIVRIVIDIFLFLAHLHQRKLTLFQLLFYLFCAKKCCRDDQSCGMCSSLTHHILGYVIEIISLRMQKMCSVSVSQPLNMHLKIIKITTCSQSKLPFMETRWSCATRFCFILTYGIIITYW